jgi:hypothetical protein
MIRHPHRKLFQARQKQDQRPQRVCQRPLEIVSPTQQTNHEVSDAFSVPELHLQGLGLVVTEDIMEVQDVEVGMDPCLCGRVGSCAAELVATAFGGVIAVCFEAVFLVFHVL